MATYKIKPLKNSDGKRCQWCLHTATHEVVLVASGRSVSQPECEAHARQSASAMERGLGPEDPKAPEGTPTEPKRLKPRPHPEAAMKEISKADFKELFDKAASAAEQAKRSGAKALEAAETIRSQEDMAKRDDRASQILFAELRAVRHRIGDAKYFRLVRAVSSKPSATETTDRTRRPTMKIVKEQLSQLFVVHHMETVDAVVTDYDEAEELKMELIAADIQDHTSARNWEITTADKFGTLAFNYGHDAGIYDAVEHDDDDDEDDDPRALLPEG